MSLVRSYREGDKSEAISAARLSWGYFCREATIYLYRTTGKGRRLELILVKNCSAFCLKDCLTLWSTTAPPPPNAYRFCPPTSEVSKRGWRTEGVGPRNPSHTMDSGLFSAPFFLSPLMSRRTQLCGAIFAVFWALLVADPLPPTPFRNLWQQFQKFLSECWIGV